MLMNDKIIFEHFDYCVNSAQKKEIMVLYILQPGHIFIRVKAFILALVPGRLRLLITSKCFGRHLVTSINKCSVLTACAHMNCHINTQCSSLLLYSHLCRMTRIYAIIALLDQVNINYGSALFELRHEKTRFLPMQNRCRSASQ